MKKITYLAFIFSLILLTGSAIFLLYNYQSKIVAEISSIFETSDNQPQDLRKNIDEQKQLAQEEQIAQLRQEIETLKQQQTQQAQDLNKATLKPASPPMVDLKTKEELARAQEQINSLTQQLVQIQAQKNTQPSPQSDAELLRSWQADEKVVRVACQDKFLNSWQLGSGVVVSADGKVLTNQHVVQSSMGLLLPDYCLILFNKDYDAQTQSFTKQYRATVSGFFQDRDAAILKINDVVYEGPTGITQSNAVTNSFDFWQIAPALPQLGDPVYVIGFPESAKFNFSVTKGIISNFTSDNIYFGTDAQIDRGNSGGAAVNSAGQLIGLPTWKYVGEGDYRGYILNIQTIKL